MTADSAASTTRARIVVGVDGSASSKHALRWAQYLAEITGTTVAAVAAWEPYGAWAAMGGGWAPMPLDRDPAADALKALDATIDEVFQAHRPPGLTAEVREGNPVRVLLDASEGALMLVVGSRGRGGFAGLLLGSVSAGCSVHASCPVVVLHGNTPPPAQIADS